MSPIAIRYTARPTWVPGRQYVRAGETPDIEGFLEAHDIPAEEVGGAEREHIADCARYLPEDNYMVMEVGHED